MKIVKMDGTRAGRSREQERMERSYHGFVLLELQEGIKVKLLLVDREGVEVGVGLQPRGDGLVARVPDREKDARDGDDIAQRAGPRELSVAMYCHRARNVTDGHLIGQLLQSQLLELHEP